MKLTGFWIFWRITSYKMAMNRWIPLNVETVDQARTARLARTLHCEIALALGYVCALWTWSARLALDGDLSDLLAGDIAHAAKYSGDDPEAFLSALISCGFIDEATDENGEVKTTISDWGYHAGGLMEMERRNELHRERQRRYRKRTSRDCDVTVTSRVTSHKRHGDATERHGDVMKHHRDPLNKDINRDKDINREKELNKELLKISSINRTRSSSSTTPTSPSRARAPGGAPTPPTSTSFGASILAKTVKRTPPVPGDVSQLAIKPSRSESLASWARSQRTAAGLSGSTSSSRPPF